MVTYIRIIYKVGILINSLFAQKRVVQNRSLRSLFTQWAAVPAVGSAARFARDIAQLRHILNVFRKINFPQATSDMPPPII